MAISGKLPCFLEVYVRRGGPGCEKLLDEVRQRIPGALQDLFTWRHAGNFLLWSWEPHRFFSIAGTNWCLQPRGHCSCNLKGIGDFWKNPCRLVASKSHFEVMWNSNRKISGGMRECSFNILPGSPLQRMKSVSSIRREALRKAIEHVVSDVTLCSRHLQAGVTKQTVHVWI